MILIFATGLPPDASEAVRQDQPVFVQHESRYIHFRLA